MARVSIATAGLILAGVAAATGVAVAAGVTISAADLGAKKKTVPVCNIVAPNLNDVFVLESLGSTNFGTNTSIGVSTGAAANIRTFIIFNPSGCGISNTTTTAAAAATDTTEIGTSIGVWILFDVTGDVESFVAGTETNKGWMIRDQTEGTTPAYTSWWRAKEFATAAVRPLLTIRWIP